MNNLDILHAVRTAEQDIGTFRLGLIYLAVCTQNGKPYVGLTHRRFRERISEHLKVARRGEDTKFYRAIRKHGEDAFAWYVLETCMPLSELAEREVHWIASLDAVSQGYNTTSGGEVGFVFSEEVLAKMSASQLREQQRRVDNGTHHFLGDRNPSHRRMEDGTHHFLSPEFRQAQSDRVTQLGVNGEHPSQNPENRRANRDRWRVHNPMHDFAAKQKNRQTHHQNRQNDLAEERRALIEAGQQVFC